MKNILYAKAGCVLTNGVDYARVVFLSDSTPPDSYYEISEQEYLDYLREEEKKNG